MVKAADSRSAGRYARVGSNPTSDINVTRRGKPPGYILYLYLFISARIKLFSKMFYTSMLGEFPETLAFISSI